jgi:hypothetical protein
MCPVRCVTYVSGRSGQFTESVRSKLVHKGAYSQPGADPGNTSASASMAFLVVAAGARLIYASCVCLSVLCRIAV